MSASKSADDDRSVVITGVGVVSPIGTGAGAFWTSLVEGRSGVARLSLAEHCRLPVEIGAELKDFDPKQHIKPRKSLKVMSHEIQVGSVAASLACGEAGLELGTVDPDRLGVTFGCDMLYGEPAELAEAYRASMPGGRFGIHAWGAAGMSRMYPLWMLKYLPNMAASHISIRYDARGPCNAPTLGDCSSLAAVIEATEVIRRGHADAMICGGTGSRIGLTAMMYRGRERLSRREADPAEASRPFDADRDGMVNGEGAAAFVLERAEFAAARGARALAIVRAASQGYHQPGVDQQGLAVAIEQTLRRCLSAADARPAQVGHANCHGLSTVENDIAEATALRSVLGGDVPVTAPKSFFGNLGSGGGAVELAATVYALQHGILPPTLNYQRPDPRCPIQASPRPQPLDAARPLAVKLSHSTIGQASCLLLERRR